MKKKKQADALGPVLKSITGSNPEQKYTALSFAYSVAIWCGAGSTGILTTDIIYTRPFEPATIAHIILSIVLFFGGIVGLFAHQRKLIALEIHAIIPVAVGFVFVLGWYVTEVLDKLVNDLPLVATTGISAGLIHVFILVLIDQYKYISKILDENRKNQKVLSKIESED